MSDDNCWRLLSHQLLLYCACSFCATSLLWMNRVERVKKRPVALIPVVFFPHAHKRCSGCSRFSRCNRNLRQLLSAVQFDQKWQSIARTPRPTHPIGGGSTQHARGCQRGPITFMRALGRLHAHAAVPIVPSPVVKSTQ